MTLTTVPFLRMTRSKRGWAFLVGASALALGSAWVQRRHGAPHGADHSLLNLYAAIAVPLLAFGLVGATVEGRGLARSGLMLERLGASPLRVAASTVLVGILGSAVVSGVVGAGVAALAHGASDPPRLRDALETFAFGAVGGAAYGAYFVFGAAMGARGWGRVVLLAVDWLLGDGLDVGAALTPRANLRNLLGGEAPLDLSPSESLAMLLFLTLGCALAASRMAIWKRWRR